MENKRTNSEIIKLILEEDMKEDPDKEEIIHMLLEKTVSKNINRKNKAALSFGERVSDKMARVAGSWAFIIIFCVILLAWVVLNTVFLLQPYDPFPYILLNLLLSCIAALQAPIIMMSQNRQEQKDRIRAENDYKVNLKSEIIIEDIYSKLEQLIDNQEIILKRISTGEEKTKENA